jgi:hypothetical protein
MAEGVRLVHNELRGVMLAVEHPSRKYKVPMVCNICNTTHNRKTYHLQLDGEGAVIVSQEVFKRLKEAGLPGLSYENPVGQPPAQRLNLNVPNAGFKGAFTLHEQKAQGGRFFVLRNKLFGPPDPEKKYGKDYYG